MKTFLIIVAVIFIIFAAVFSLSATFTIIYDKKWKTTIKVLWIEKDIELTKILSFILFPKEKAEQVKAEKQADKAEKASAAEEKPAEVQNEQPAALPAEDGSEKASQAPDSKKEEEAKPQPQKQKKPNFIKTLYDKEGIVGIMLLISNMLQSASSALGTLIKGFHIYSLYVKIIVGGGDAADIAKAYGMICKYYYPLKGAVLSGMKVDNFDDWIAPDFIAPSNEYGFQFIGSISVGLLLKVALSAVKTFVINLLKNK